MKRYIAVLEIDDDEEIVGDANISYTYRRNGTNYATSESVEFEAESGDNKAVAEEQSTKRFRVYAGGYTFWLFAKNEKEVIARVMEETGYEPEKVEEDRE